MVRCQEQRRQTLKRAKMISIRSMHDPGTRSWSRIANSLKLLVLVKCFYVYATSTTGCWVGRSRRVTFDGAFGELGEELD